MPDLAYVLRSLTGAWLLAKADRRGLDYFDITIEGFWRSFLASVVALPAFLLLYLATNTHSLSFGGLLANGLIYLIGWLVLPIIAIPITRLLGLSNRYVALIVATNWASVLELAAFVVISLVVSILPSSMQAGFYLIGVFLILLYDWFVIRTSLDTSISIAISIVVIDLLLGLLVSSAFSGG